MDYPLSQDPQRVRRSASSAPLVWSGGLAAGVLGGSLVLSCIMPFAAIAALAAGALPLRRALLLVALVWALNQAIGFGWLGFPRDAPTVLWGLGIGITALGMTVAASLLLARLADRPLGLRAGAAFLAAFAFDQAGMLVVAQVVNGACVVDPKVISAVALNNAAWFVGLLILEAAARPVLRAPFGFTAGTAFVR
jgi:hypothetical protein